MDAPVPALAMSDPHTVRGLLSRIKIEESRRVKDVAALNFQLNQQKKKNQKLESETKLERDKRRFKENELVHLKLALHRAYDTIDRLERKLGACEEYHVHSHELDKAEERHAVVQAKLLEKESQLFSAVAKLNDVKKTNEKRERENVLVKAKYEQLMRSEHALALEVRSLQTDLNALKQANERRAELVGSLNSSDRDETIKTLLRVGRNLPGKRHAYGDHHIRTSSSSFGNLCSHSGCRDVFDQDVCSDDGSSIGAVSL